MILGERDFGRTDRHDFTANQPASTLPRDYIAPRSARFYRRDGNTFQFDTKPIIAVEGQEEKISEAKLAINYAADPAGLMKMAEYGINYVEVEDTEGDIITVRGKNSNKDTAAADGYDRFLQKKLHFKKEA